MKKVISYALFGECTPYAMFVPAVIRANLTLFSRLAGWVTRIHIGRHKNDYSDSLFRLAEDGLVELQFMDTHAPLCKAMLWRIAPVFDPEVEVVFCRDLDAIATPRERTCMEDFVTSNATIHTVWDSPYHDGIMGGLSGFRASAFREQTGFQSLEDLYKAGESAVNGLDWAKHGADQEVLNHVLSVQKRLSISVSKNPNEIRGLSSELLVAAEKLAPHLGSAGFNIPSAISFYNNVGDPEVMRKIAQAELK